MGSRPPNQHYVPKLLLRRFVSASERMLFVFDKETERCFTKPIKKVASDRGFYDCEVDGRRYSIDPLLTLLENRAGRIIDQIVAARSLRGLTHGDRKTIALFATVQMLRTEAQRKQWKDLNDDLRVAIERAGMNPAKVQGFDFLDIEQTRIASIASLPGLARDLSPHILNKQWILFGTSAEHPFYTSDNPVTLFNRNRHPFRSTLGLGVRGIEIYLPVSPTLSLAFLCSTIKLPWRYRLFGGTLGVTPENVEHFNSLQVLNAEQYIYSHCDDFALVLQMIQAHPEVKRGPRWG